MVAPHWVSNAAVMLYVTRGNGRLEMVHPDGRQAVRREVNAGDGIVAPVGYAFALVRVPCCCFRRQVSCCRSGYQQDSE